MKEVTIYMNDWLQQIGRQRTTSSDTWYLHLAKQLLSILEAEPWLTQHTQLAPRQVALMLTAYLHDAIAQTGGWKHFTNTYQNLYKRTLPFYETGNDYLPDEINVADIAYLLWTACTGTETHVLSPLHPELWAVSQTVYQLFDHVFEDAPISELPSTHTWVPGVDCLREASTPLPEITPGSTLKKDVQQCLTYSQGHPLIFLDTYDALQTFLIEALSWQPQPEGLLSDLKEESLFVIYANAKGMLLAPNVAPCFRDTHNPYYDAQAAKTWGYELFTTPGACPFDLLKYGMQKGLLPDVELPFEQGKELLHQHWDFIARYFLNEYYEGD